MQATSDLIQPKGENMFTALSTTNLDAARRIYISCAWTCALTGEEDIPVATAQLFFVMAEFLAMFVE